MASDYGYGDAQVLNSSITAGTGNASSIGEVSLSNGFASASGSNSMTAFLTVTTPGTVTFTFNATPYMWAELTAGGISAIATSSMSVTLNSVPLFSWAPGDLNRNVSQAFGVGASSYTPGALSFSATTGNLATGSYNLGLSMSNTASVASVPLPAAGWMLISGVLGLVAVVRRRAM